MEITLIVKIHRYWHFMSDNDTIWILYVSIPLCKSSHFQCDAGGKAATYTADESTQQQNNHIFYMYCCLYKKINIYTHIWFYIYSA